jgi:hypothetical protein
MEHLPIHICSQCRHLQSYTTRQPEFIVCNSCGDRDTAPITTRFGRQEWDASDYGDDMLACLPLLGIELTPRKVRLISCAAARTQFSATDNTDLRRAVALAEEWADTGIRPKSVAVARRALIALARPRQSVPAWAMIGMRCLAENADVQPLPFPFGQLLAPICREQFGNPFAAPDWNPDWLTSTVRDLAAHIYTVREFSALPILADALQDAGCDDEQILGHCRANKAHVRGCWAVDAILGKT